MSEHDEDRLLRDVASAARRVPPPSSGLDTRIMAAVHAAARPRWRIALGWFTAPRTVRLSPAAGLAAAAGLVLAVLLLSQVIGAGRPPSPRDVALSTADSVPAMRFVLVAPEAATVALVGDFNHWRPEATPLRPAGADGVWVVDVRLTPGRHEYAFVVDGTRWVPDPAAPRAPVGDFGTPNSVITVIPGIS